MTHDEKRSILVVDDDDVFRTRLARAFADRGLVAHEARGGAAAIAFATEDSPELAVVDLHMPDRSGLEVVRCLKEIDPATSVVVLTGYGSIATALEAMRLGATHYLTKPANADEILAAFEGRKRAPESSPEVVESDPPSLARMEWEHIQRILNDCGGNISQAARVLNLHRRSLQRKLSKRPAAR
jgi:two-component system response regulator RegA